MSTWTYIPLVMIGLGATLTAIKVAALEQRVRRLEKERDA